MIPYPVKDSENKVTEQGKVIYPSKMDWRVRESKDYRYTSSGMSPTEKGPLGVRKDSPFSIVDLGVLPKS